MKRAGGASTRRVRRARNPDVFLNVPFDRAYEKCFIALVAGLAGCGLRARSVLELPADRDRLALLFSMLGRCSASLNDLSRQVGRFNMPFEAGMAKALQLGGRPHAVFFLETRPWRLLKTLSDAKQDAYVHGGRPYRVLRIVATIFARPRKTIRPEDLRRIYRRLSRKIVPDLRRRWGKLHDRGAFGELTYAARSVAQQLGLP